MNQQIGPQPAFFARHRGLRLEIAMIQHAGHLHHAAQLHLAPVAARGGRTQRRHQLAGFGAKLLLGFGQAAHLLLQSGVGGRARRFQLLDARIHLVERRAHRRHQFLERLLPLFQIAARRGLRLRQIGACEIEKRLIVPRQRFGGKRLENGRGILAARPQHQPRQQEPGNKTRYRENVLH